MNTKSGLRSLIGDKAFYRRTVTIVLPIMIQNTITNVVSLLDNVMVGQVGTLQMSAVAIINQLLFVFNLCIFGGLAGPGIFATQFAGAGDTEGVRSCFRVKFLLGCAMSVIAVAVFTLAPESLIGLYLTESGSDGMLVMGYAKEYLGIMSVGLLPFALSCAYAMTLRETGETRLPMIASVTAILVNLVFNWIFIFGHLSFPAMGVAGAAAATVLSRFVELAIIVIASHSQKSRFHFVDGLYKTLRIPAELLRDITIKGAPLLVNEFLWSSGMAAILACYSMRGIEVVAACNIASTINNLFNVFFISMGNAVGIMVGQALGADEKERAVTEAWQLMAFSFVISALIGCIMFLLAPAIPQIYNTEAHVRDTAANLLRVLAVIMPFCSISNNCYFTLRSGGKTIITFFFDSVFTWGVNYLGAWLLVTMTAFPIVVIYACVQGMELIKNVIGLTLVKKGIWINNMVS